MRGTTIRRLLVFGVCALGVSALYLVPSVARSPQQIAAPDRTDVARPTTPTNRAKPIAATNAPGTATPTGTTASIGPAEPTRTTLTAAPDRGEQNSITTAPTSTPASTPARPAGTPFTPGRQRDENPPAAVPALKLERVTADEATISWPAASDDVGVTQYRVWLNGFVVETTTETRATVRWFNDDSSSQIVQVRAVDAAGNESRSAPSLLAERPTAAPTPTTSPTESATPGPTGPSATQGPEQLDPASSTETARAT